MRIERRPWLAAQPRKRAISWRKIPLLDSRGSEWWIVLSEGGVPKRPVSEAIIARLGIEGDGPVLTLSITAGRKRLSF